MALCERPAWVHLMPHPSDKEPSLPKKGGKGSLHLTDLCGGSSELIAGSGGSAWLPVCSGLGSPSSSPRPASPAFRRPFSPKMPIAEMKWVGWWHLFLTVLLGVLGMFLWEPSVWDGQIIQPSIRVLAGSGSPFLVDLSAPLRSKPSPPCKCISFAGGNQESATSDYLPRSPKANSWGRMGLGTSFFSVVGVFSPLLGSSP